MLKQFFSTAFFNTKLANAVSDKPSASHDNHGVFCTIEELIALKLNAAQLQFPLRNKSKSHLNGPIVSSLRGRGIDFDEVRAYQAGDEIRSIDWRVTARTGQVHTKVYKEEKEKPVYVLLDLRKPMFFGSERYFKSAIACHLASLLAWSSLKNGDRFGSIIFSDNRHQEIKPKSSSKSVLAFLKLAADYSQVLSGVEINKNPNTVINNSVDKKTDDNDSISLANAVQKLLQIIRPGSLVYIISDFHDFDDEVKKNLSLMSRHNDLIALKVSDALEHTLPQSQRLLFTNSKAEDSAVSEIQGQQKNIFEQYQQHFIEKQNRLEHELMLARVPCMTVNTGQEAFEQLQYGKRQGEQNGKR